MGLLALLYVVILLVGLIVAVFARIGQAILALIVALLDREPEPVAEEHLVAPAQPREVVARSRSEAEIRLDRYCRV